jgi:hypothetical protein
LSSGRSSDKWMDRAFFFQDAKVLEFGLKLGTCRYVQRREMLCEEAAGPGGQQQKTEHVDCVCV